MATLRSPGLKVQLLVGPTCKIPRSTQRGVQGIRRSPKKCQSWVFHKPLYTRITINQDFSWFMSGVFFTFPLLPGEFKEVATDLSQCLLQQQRDSTSKTTTCVFSDSISGEYGKMIPYKLPESLLIFSMLQNLCNWAIFCEEIPQTTDNWRQSVDIDTWYHLFLRKHLASVK